MSAENCRYTQEHEWISVVGNVATIGISSYAVDELGEIVFVDLPEVDAEFEQMAEFGSVESVKTVSSLYSPVSGKVTQINEKLKTEPELLNSSPYDNGWLIKMVLSDPIEIDDLMSHSEYTHYIESL
jgi:glycine cleavage system H protein